MSDVVAYEPIKAVQVLGGSGFPAVLRKPEKASDTAKLGVPLKLDSGYLCEQDDPITTDVYGVNNEPFHDLTASGTAEDGVSEGTPVNQPSGKKVPVGAWIRDGNIGAYLANGMTMFSIVLILGQVHTAAMDGVRYEINKDGTTGQWILDNTDNGTSAEHVAKCIGHDPDSPNSATLGCRVFFVFDEAIRYFD